MPGPSLIKCGPQTSSSITQDLVRKADLGLFPKSTSESMNFQKIPGSSCEYEIMKGAGRGQSVFQLPVYMSVSSLGHQPRKGNTAPLSLLCFLNTYYRASHSKLLGTVLNQVLILPIGVFIKQPTSFFFSLNPAQGKEQESTAQSQFTTSACVLNNSLFHFKRHDNALESLVAELTPQSC